MRLSKQLNRIFWSTLGCSYQLTQDEQLGDSIWQIWRLKYSLIKARLNSTEGHTYLKNMIVIRRILLEYGISVPCYPEHTDESAGLCLIGSLSGPLANRLERPFYLYTISGLWCMQQSHLLSKYRDGIRSCSLVTPIKGQVGREVGVWNPMFESSSFRICCDWIFCIKVSRYFRMGN